MTNATLWGYRVICLCGGYEQRVNGTKAEALAFWRAHRRAASAATGVAVRQEDRMEGTDGTTSTQQDAAQTVSTEATSADGTATAAATATTQGEGDAEQQDEGGSSDE